MERNITQGRLELVRCTFRVDINLLKTILLTVGCPQGPDPELGVRLFVAGGLFHSSRKRIKSYLFKNVE